MRKFCRPTPDGVCDIAPGHEHDDCPGCGRPASADHHHPCERRFDLWSVLSAGWQMAELLDRLADRRPVDDDELAAGLARWREIAG